jgi:large subunit ribosomal protein L31
MRSGPKAGCRLSIFSERHERKDLSMKEGIHPKYMQAAVTCACGNTFVTRSTIPTIRVEICAACHPFYTGRQKLMDTAGRVERFEKRFAKTGGKTVHRKPATTKAVPKESKATKKILRNAPRAAPPAKTARMPGGKPPKPAAR